ncbi:hypothetical protein KIPB_010448, partial [Kipferlia bialata]
SEGVNERIPHEFQSEYQQLQSRYLTQTSDDTVSLSALERGLAQVQGKAEDAKSRLETMDRAVAQGKERLAAAEADLERFTTEYAAAKAEKEKVKKELEAARQRVLSAEKDQEEGRTRLDLATRTLRNRESFNVATKAEQRRRRAVSALISDVRGVYGTLSSLIKVNNPQRHSVAVKAALGRNADAVVVDTVNTASDAIRFLRTQRLTTLSFLPLSVLREPQSIPVPQGLALASELVSCAQREVSRAVKFALSDTLVAPTMESASDAWRQHRVRVVTESGTVFNKGGSISAECNPGADRRRTKADQGVSEEEVERAQTEAAAAKDNYMAVTRELQKAREAIGGDRAGEADSKATALKNKLRAARNRVKEATKEVAGATKAMEEEKKAGAKHTKALQTAKDAVSAVVRRMHRTQDRLFADLLDRMRQAGHSHASIRDFDDEEGSRQRKKDRVRLQAELASAEAQLLFLGDADYATRAAKAKKQAARYTKEATRLEAELQELEGQDSVSSEEDLATNRAVKEAEREAEDVSKRLAQSRKHVQNHLGARGRARATLSAVLERERTVEVRRAQLLERCKCDGVLLPLLRTEGAGDVAMDGGSESEGEEDAPKRGKARVTTNRRGRRVEESEESDAEESDDEESEGAMMQLEAVYSAVNQLLASQSQDPTAVQRQQAKGKGKGKKGKKGRVRSALMSQEEEEEEEEEEREREMLSQQVEGRETQDLYSIIHAAPIDYSRVQADLDMIAKDVNPVSAL